MPNNQVDHQTLRPGYLVSLVTRVKGNVKHDKEVIEEEHRIRSGATQVTWQTTRTVADPEEHKKANKARMKCRAIICGVCAKSDFGLLCLKSDIDKLLVAETEAQRVATTFNRSARLTRVEVYVFKGLVEQNDVQAARAIKSEVRELLKEMTDGIRNCDVKKIRDAAGKAKSVGTMLNPDMSAELKAAILSARGAATKIKKAGDDAAQEIDRQAITAIQAARTSFLDVIDEDEEEANEAPVAEASAEAPVVARVRPKKAKAVKKAMPKKRAAA